MPVKVTGFTEIAQDLRSAAQRLDDTSKARAALRVALTPMLEDARAKMPKRTGKTAAQLAAVDMQAPDGVARVGVGMKGNRAFIARMLEYGTSKMPARPWMRPAWDGGRASLLTRVVAGLREQIGQIFRKAA